MNVITEIKNSLDLWKLELCEKAIWTSHGLHASAYILDLVGFIRKNGYWRVVWLISE